MKNICKLLFVAALCIAVSFGTQAQSTGKLRVSTQLKETNGNYDQRRLYREFLTDYLKKCPYISDFQVQEVPGSADNHLVIWSYDVNNWDQITSFYNWINTHLKKKSDGLKVALTPFQPDYAIGGVIQVEKKSKSELAKERSSKTKGKQENNG